MIINQSYHIPFQFSMAFGFSAEPVQKPTQAPDNITEILNKKDPSQQILKKIFFIGTEPFNVKLIFDYAWAFPKLTEHIQVEKLLQKKKFTYFFGQTEPIVINSEQVFVPIIICIQSDNEIPFQLSLTSVQASSEQIIDLSELKLSLNELLIEYKDKKKKHSDAAHVLQLNGRFDKISKAQENNYTYSNLYLPITSYLQSQLKLLKTPESADIELKYNGQKYQDICIDKSDNLEEQAKFIICKYILKLNMSDLDVNSQNIDKEMLDDILKQINNGIISFDQQCEEKRKVMKKRVDDSKILEDALKDMEVIKYYPIDADEDIFIKTSGFVNRYFGQATKIVQ